MMNSDTEIIENWLKCDRADTRAFNCNYIAIMEIKFVVSPHANSIVMLSNSIEYSTNMRPIFASFKTIEFPPFSLLYFTRLRLI